MKQISDDDMKVLALTMLKDVANFCDSHNIKYYLCGGTLLGAVRHKGFIPWDDDIDIMMPRPDYLRFLESYNGSNSRYIVKGIENDETYWRTFAKVFDTATHLDESAIYLDKPDNGVFIDIFPVDGITTNTFKRAILFKEQEFLNFLYHGSAWTYTKSFKYADSFSRFAKIKGLIRTYLKYIAVTVLRPLPTYSLIKLINKNAQKTNYDGAKYVGTIVDCHYGAACEMLPKEGFEDAVKLPFEDDEFWVMGNYKLYLQNLYGDYMKLPPESSRVTHHDFVAYWKDDWEGR